MNEKSWPNPICRESFIDSCAFDPKYNPEDKAALNLFKLKEQGIINLEIAYSTLKEINHPHTPDWVKKKASEMIYTKEVGLTSSEIKHLHDIENILAGDGKIENIKEDALHIFECQKHGDYFITTDKRILKKRDALRKLYSLMICKPSEFLDLINYYLPKQKIQ